MIESLTLALSYPLRLMATFGAVAVLKLCGVAVTADRTLMTLGSDGTGIVVTDACSGIEQLFALVLVGGAFAWLMQKSIGFRILHWACILPSLVLANALRLVATVLLYNRFGEVILGDAWHHGLGYAQSVLTLVLLWGFGKLLALAADAPGEAAVRNKGVK